MNALGVGSVAEDANDDPRCRVVAGVLPAFSKVTDILMTGEADVDDACNVSRRHLDSLPSSCCGKLCPSRKRRMGCWLKRFFRVAWTGVYDGLGCAGDTRKPGVSGRCRTPYPFYVVSKEPGSCMLWRTISSAQ